MKPAPLLIVRLNKQAACGRRPDNRSRWRAIIDVFAMRPTTDRSGWRWRCQTGQLRPVAPYLVGLSIFHVGSHYWQRRHKHHTRPRWPAAISSGILVIDIRDPRHPQAIATTTLREETTLISRVPNHNNGFGINFILPGRRASLEEMRWCLRVGWS